jgi:hypothetical protein
MMRIRAIVIVFLALVIVSRLLRRKQQSPVSMPISTDPVLDSIINTSINSVDNDNGLGNNGLGNNGLGDDESGGQDTGLGGTETLAPVPVSDLLINVNSL